MRKDKAKQKAATARELEELFEQLMLEVAESFPRNPHHLEELTPWAHMTAMYISEIVKRRASPRETIIKKAGRAVRRRVERELADSYLGMELPGRPEDVLPVSPSTQSDSYGDAADVPDDEPRNGDHSA